MFCSSSDSSDQFYVYMLQCVLQHDHRHRWMMLSNRDLSFPVILTDSTRGADAGEDVRPGSFHQGSRGALKGTR